MARRSWYRFRDARRFAPYASVENRRRQASVHVALLAKQGRHVTPVRIEGRAIAKTFWGKAWCEHLESWSDFENRLPRGRAYVRNNAVIDLVIAPGKVAALVSGSTVYEIAIAIEPLASAAWEEIGGECAGKIESVIELLQGRLSGGVMEVMTRREGGLFPAPHQVAMRCSCPDFAAMCKHIAATLYGIGARLDDAPELLFTLRGVDHRHLIGANTETLLVAPQPASDRVLENADLSEIFGIDLDLGSTPASTEVTPKDDAPATIITKRKVAPSHDLDDEPIATSILGPAQGLRKRLRAEPRRPPIDLERERRARSRQETITAKDLVARGIPHSTIQSWLRSGTLTPSGRRGVYNTTLRTESRIEAYLAIKKMASQGRASGSNGGTGRR